MIEFSRAASLLIPPEERLEVAIRVIDPVFAVMWLASLRCGAGNLFLELEAKKATGALIDREGVIRWRLDCETGSDFAVQYMLRHIEDNPSDLFIFGEEAGKWPNEAAARTSSRVFSADDHEVRRAAAKYSDLIYDERVSGEGWNVEQARATFGEMMDRALAAAVRVGYDADDVECERLVRWPPGASWFTLEEWARDHPKVHPSELRLRSVIVRPAPMLPALVQVQ